MLLEFIVLLLLLNDGSIRKILIVSGGITARLLPLVHLLMAALFEDSSAFTLSFATGVFTLRRVGSGPVAVALSAALLAVKVGNLAIFVVLRDLFLPLFQPLRELVNTISILEARKFSGLSFPIPLSLFSWLAMVWTIIVSVRACAGVTFRELVVRAFLALQ